MILSSRSDIGLMTLREILGLTPQTFAARFKGTSVKRLKLAGLLRNACVAAGNSGDAGLVEPLLGLLGHESPLVRAHAVWAARRLGAGNRLGGPRAKETDPVVIEEYEAELPGPC
jgi:epoxyqueuosine reductase